MCCIRMNNITINYRHTSQKNSLPRRPQNHEIHETSSELLMIKFIYLICRNSFKKQENTKKKKCLKYLSNSKEKCHSFDCLNNTASNLMYCLLNQHSAPPTKPIEKKTLSFYTTKGTYTQTHSHTRTQIHRTNKSNRKNCVYKSIEFYWFECT